MNYDKVKWASSYHRQITGFPMSKLGMLYLLELVDEKDVGEYTERIAERWGWIRGKPQPQPLTDEQMFQALLRFYGQRERYAHFMYGQLPFKLTLLFDVGSQTVRLNVCDFRPELLKYLYHEFNWQPTTSGATARTNFDPDYTPDPDPDDMATKPFIVVHKDKIIVKMPWKPACKDQLKDDVPYEQRTWCPKPKAHWELSATEDNFNAARKALNDHFSDYEVFNETGEHQISFDTALDTSSYYALLKIDEGATHKEIKKAYRALVKELHPDLVGEAVDTAHFHRVQKAYETLKDERRRKKYDLARKVMYKKQSTPDFSRTPPKSAPAGGRSRGPQHQAGWSNTTQNQAPQIHPVLTNALNKMIYDHKDKQHAVLSSVGVHASIVSWQTGPKKGNSQSFSNNRFVGVGPNEESRFALPGGIFIYYHMPADEFRLAQVASFSINKQGEPLINLGSVKMVASYGIFPGERALVQYYDNGPKTQEGHIAGFQDTSVNGICLLLDHAPSSQTYSIPLPNLMDIQH